MSGRQAVYSERGFTLVELILVMVILGIFAVATSQFIRSSALLVADSSARTAIVNDARFIFERLTRELRSAVPGSIRISCEGNACSNQQCLEYVAIKAATSYLDSAPGTNQTNPTLTVLPPSQTVAVNDQLLVYPTSSSDVYGTSSSKRRTITNITIATGTEQWQLSAGVSHQSPGKRIYVLSVPTSFCFSNGELRLVTGYGLTSSQSTIGAGLSSGSLLQAGVQLDWSDAPFSYAPASLTRTAVVNLKLALQASNQEVVEFNHEIHIPNVP